MPKEWYISFHGGDEKVSFNNIHVYSTDGKELRKALNKESIPEGVTLRELRGFVCFQPKYESRREISRSLKQDRPARDTDAASSGS